MRAVIVTNSTSYEPRAENVGQFLEKCGCQVMWLESDFNHREKEKKKRQLDCHQYIDTIPYKKNMSLKRLYSQYDFARKTFKILKDQSFDLLYVMIPANSLTPVAARLKKRCHGKLVLDLIDLWPESLPVNGLERFWPIQCWRKLRDNYLASADLILTECKFYQELLRFQENPEIRQTAVMYWPKEKEAKNWTAVGAMDAGKAEEDGSLQAERKTDNETGIEEKEATGLESARDRQDLHLAYLGSINHIIDMDQILDLLRLINQKKKICLHIIGDGESRQLFLEKLTHAEIVTEYHGTIYDEEKKKQIFDRCGFGINMMKESVCVGLTMKSVDYFCYGLPLINNIQGDTWNLIEEYEIGVNCRRDEPEKCAEKIVRMSETMKEKRYQIRKLYEKLFTRQAMEEVLKKEVLPLLEKES